MGCAASVEVSVPYASKSDLENATAYSTLYRVTKRSSDADTAVEPSNFVKSVKIKMKNFQSYMTVGINNEMDQFQDEVARCTGTFTSSDKQRGSVFELLCVFSLLFRRHPIHRHLLPCRPGRGGGGRIHLGSIFCPDLFW